MHTVLKMELHRVQHLAGEQPFNSTDVFFLLCYRLLEEILHISRLLYCVTSCVHEHALI